MTEPTVWQRIRSWVFPSSEEQRARQEQRINELTRALARHPHAAATYVSRGEAYLEVGDAERAASDFGQALSLSEAQFKTEAWGMVAQAVRDRALRGLKQARGE